MGTAPRFDILLSKRSDFCFKLPFREDIQIFCLSRPCAREAQRLTRQMFRVLNLKQCAAGPRFQSQDPSWSRPPLAVGRGLKEGSSFCQVGPACGSRWPGAFQLTGTVGSAGDMSLTRCCLHVYRWPGDLPQCQGITESRSGYKPDSRTARPAHRIFSRECMRLPNPHLLHNHRDVATKNWLLSRTDGGHHRNQNRRKKAQNPSHSSLEL